MSEVSLISLGGKPVPLRGEYTLSPNALKGQSETAYSSE